MAQTIHFLVIALLDDIAITHRDRRLLVDRCKKQLIQICQTVKFIADLRSQFTVDILKQRCDRRQHLNRVTKSNHIPWIRGLVCNSCDQTLEIIDWI